MPRQYYLSMQSADTCSKVCRKHVRIGHTLRARTSVIKIIYIVPRKATVKKINNPNDIFEDILAARVGFKKLYNVHII